MTPLHVYVAADCRICDRTRQIVAEVRALRPDYPIELIDLDLAGTSKPAAVFGTPTYCLGERIISLGNPALQDLVTLMDAEIARGLAAPPAVRSRIV